MHRALSSALCRLGLFALALGGAAVAVPSLAAADHNLRNPLCNHVVHQSVTLVHDMFCNLAAEQAAIIIGNGGITVNLNGFRIVNTSGQTGTTGVDDFSQGSFDRVTIKNGEINGFDDGIGIIGGHRDKIAHIILSHNSDEGIFFGNSHHGLLTDVNASSNGCDGIDMHDNDRVTVVDSKADRNGCNGISDMTSLATINHVKTNHNKADGIFVDFPVLAGGVPYLIENSTANANRKNGFEIEDNTLPTDEAKLIHNSAENNTGTNPSSPTGWGYWAAKPAKGKGNGAKGNVSGACFQVPCHTNP
jgi:Right handed beta helix region